MRRLLAFLMKEKGGGFFKSILALISLFQEPQDYS
jgi:hypothetical protein